MELIILSITCLSTLLFLVAFFIYNKDMFKEKTQPSLTTWGLFSLLTLINSTSYFSITGDIFKSLLSFTDFAVCLIITLVILYKKVYTKLSRVDLLIVSISLLSVLVWLVLKSAVYANLILQLAYILAFVPTIINTLKQPISERPLPWFIWSVSFILTLVVIFLRWEGHLVDLISPSIGLILHLTIGTLALKRKQFLTSPKM